LIPGHFLFLDSICGQAYPFLVKGGTDSVKFSRREFIVYSFKFTTGIGFLTESCLASLTRVSTSHQSKEEILKQLDALVDTSLPVFGTCSQTSFYALNETFNLKSDNIVKALAPFPGIALRGETCGAVTGSLMAIALIYEDDDIKNKSKKLSNPPSFTFCSQFESEFGSTRCRDVIEHVTKKKYDISKPEDYKILSQDGALKNCHLVIKKAIHLAAEIMLEKF